MITIYPCDYKCLITYVICYRTYVVYNRKKNTSVINPQYTHVKIQAYYLTHLFASLR
jgi:hypothetical protein